jgi:type IV pilus assembly protein PilB
VLGRLLIASGAATEAQVAQALEEQRVTRERLGEVLVRRGILPEHIARCLAQQLRLPFAEAPLEPAPDALRLVVGALAVRLRVIPLTATERTLSLAMADPLDARAVDDLQFQTGRRVQPAVATPSAIDAALSSAYGASTISALVGRIAAPAAAYATSPADDVSALRRASEAAPIIALVDLMLERAVECGASDLHVEPSGTKLRVRARVDGILRELMELPEHAAAGVVSRMKIMARLDIAVKRKPQDGRCVARVAGKDYAARVSTLPANGGEKVVLRLLDSGNAGRPLHELGFLDAQLAQLRRLLARGHGVMLVTGPTGSGKTTTLYAALAELDREQRNIITLEDPVEYKLPGLTQVQVHRKAGLGFAAALRAVLRQDPDVIMVGELRDRETVETAMAAALTGHLVLSTLHTNDAPSTVTRLIEMGAAPYLIAGGLIGIVAQRLARRLCTSCGGATGCARCDNGYRGRVGIYEVLTLDSRIRQLIVRRAPAHALREAARNAGMISLAQDARAKVDAGLTSTAEVQPLLALLDDDAPSCIRCGTPLHSGYVACPGCGTPLRRRCACGASLDLAWRCCPSCGKAVQVSLHADSLREKE